MQQIEQGDQMHIIFEGLGGARAVHRWIEPFKSSRANMHVQSVIRHAERLDDAAIAAGRDARLSGAGRHEQVQPMRDALGKAASDGRGRLGMIERELTQDHAKLYALPALDAADVGAPQREEEIRRRFPNLGEAQAANLRAEIAAGERDGMLFALARDPIPTPDSVWATGLWAKRVEAANPKEIERLQKETAAIKWATNTIIGIEHAASKPVVPLAVQLV